MAQPITMYHPDLPGQEIDVLDPRGVGIHRQSGWRTRDELPNTDQKKLDQAEAERAKAAEAEQKSLAALRGATDNKE